MLTLLQNETWVKRLRFVVVAIVLIVLGKAWLDYQHRKQFFTFSPQETIGFVREDAKTQHVWYVNPQTRHRYFIEKKEDLARVASENFLGINERDFAALQTDAARRQTKLGAVLLRVEKAGEAWYVDPAGELVNSLGRLDDLELVFSLSKVVPTEVIQPIPVAATSPSWLKPPPGYTAEIVATDFAKPRVLTFDDQNHLFVSNYDEKGDIIALLNPDKEGRFKTKKTIIPDLFNPHGIAFADKKIFVATEHALFSWFYDANKTGVISPPTRLEELPAGGEQFVGQGHRTRTLVNGQDGYLYMSIGSNCDHCQNAGDDYASIFRINLQTGVRDVFASGLRNTVFFVKNPQTGNFWGNDMGQDNLGDDLPPDELNLLVSGNDYGWPFCYGNKIAGPDTKDKSRCERTIPPSFSYQAHSAPLGIRFMPTGDLLVAFHGASVVDDKRGYKVIQVHMDHGKPVSMDDYIGGFLREEIVLGRPVDVLFDKAGNLYISDDYARVIHKLIRTK